MDALPFLSAFLALSLSLNAVLLFALKQGRKKKPDFTAQMLLRDLLSGGAVVKVTPIDKSEIIIRSPRDLR